MSGFLSILLKTKMAFWVDEPCVSKAKSFDKTDAKDSIEKLFKQSKRKSKIWKNLPQPRL